MADRNYLLVLAALLILGDSYTIGQCIADYSFTDKHKLIWC